jgi:hypothetical protein
MVVCAANLISYDSGGHLQHAIAIGPRHFDPTMHGQIAAFKAAGIGSRRDWLTSQQGFIDQRGIFMTREEAWEVAVAAGQVRYGPHLSGGRLDSSDLY